jgi:ABC-2 type transport system permease protein
VRAKIEAVMGGVAMVFAPFIALLALLSPLIALVLAVGVVIAAASATAIQLWFGTQAKRSHFRVGKSPRASPLSPKRFSSIAWAATGALAATRPQGREGAADDLERDRV